jgi:hypothetical protein
MMGTGDNRWIPLEEALQLHMQDLGLPEAFRQEPSGTSEPQQPGIMWLSDHAIMVHETPLGLALDREEFNALLDQIKPGSLR